MSVKRKLCGLFRTTPKFQIQIYNSKAALLFCVLVVVFVFHFWLVSLLLCLLRLFVLYVILAL